MTVWSLIPLVTSIAYIVLLILVLPYASKRANRVFAFYLAVAACWSFSSFMLHLNANPANALLWNEILAVALAGTLIAYLHFIHAYTNRRAGLGVLAGYALLVALAFFSFRGDVIKDASVVEGVLTNEYGIGVYLLGGISVVFVVPVAFLLAKAYRNSLDPAERNRTLYMVVGWGILVALTYTNAFIPVLSGFPLDHAGSLLNAVIIAIAISRHHLLDIRLIARRGLAYSMLAVVILGIAAGAVLLGQAFFPTERTYFLVLVGAVLIFLLAILVRPLSKASEILVDRLFYGETYNYRQTLLAFSSSVGNIINLDELADKMLPIVTSALRITEAKLMFQQIGGGNFTTQYAYPKDEKGTGDGLAFGVDNPLVVLLSKEKEPVDLKRIDSFPQLKGMWQTDRDTLIASGLEFLHPIKSRDNLIGILALGKKRNHGLYLSEDIELIKSMSSQAGIIVDNARVYSQAVTRANTDGLTELYNHRHFHERIDQEIARGSRFGSMFSLVMLDVDHLKVFNDNYGHLAGDEVLRRVARAIESSIRSVDMAFRYGGEEFTVILPGTRLTDAYRVAERIRNTIEAKAGPGAMPVTASLGVSSWPGDGVTKQDIIGRADAALYHAKQNGRNRVMLSSEVVKGQTSLMGLELQTKERAVSIIYALAATVDAKDHYTYGHSKKVSQYAVGIAEALGLPQDRVATIRAAGLLHDIGKIAIPDSVLNKAGPLTDEEWEPVRQHPELGIEILKHVIDLVKCLPGILHHHEHFDGGGYPEGLKGEDIPLEARVLAIADAYDAITSIRPYHTQRSPQEALDELQRCAGTQFDPGLLKVFCRTLESVLPRQLEVD